MASTRNPPRQSKRAMRAQSGGRDSRFGGPDDSGLSPEAEAALRRRRRSLAFGRVLGGIGKTLISAGTIILLFVVYQLWGTNLQEARSQNALGNEFEATLDSAAFVEVDVASLAAAADDFSIEQLLNQARTDAPPLDSIVEGEAVAAIRIPKIGVDKTVVEGVGVPDLRKAPGHYPGTPLPGQPGNAAIAGHRTTYGQPFYRLDELVPGDPIFVTTPQGQFAYRVTEQLIVRPSQVEVLEPKEGVNELTLTTCHPRFSARQRMIIKAELIGEAAPAPDPGDRVAIEAPKFESIDSGIDGRADRMPAFLWGLIAAAVWAIFSLVGRMWRKLPAYLLGTPIFLAVLYVFFENFSLLLPSNF